MVIVIMFVERNGNERHPDGAGRREAKMPHDAPELPPNLVHDFTKNQEKLVRETKSRAKVLGGKALSEVTPLPRKTGSQGKMCKICQHTPLSLLLQTGAMARRSTSRPATIRSCASLSLSRE